MKNELIGRNMRGFKFESTNLLRYNETTMNARIGVIGEIKEYLEYCDGYRCDFADGVSFQYPAALIAMQRVAEGERSKGYADGWDCAIKEHGLD